MIRERTPRPRPLATASLTAVLPALLLGALLLGAGPARAMQPCPVPPPVHPIWPTAGTTDVPQDAVVFVRRAVPPAALLDLWVVDTVTGKRVAADVVPSEEAPLVVLRPQAPLVAGHGHDVWARVRAKGGRDFGRPVPSDPGARDVLVVTFTPVERSAGPAAPGVPTPDVRFGEWEPFDGNMAHIRMEGRDADLHFPAAAAAGPVVLLVKATYDPGEGGAPARWTAARAFGSPLSLSVTEGMPCAGWEPPRPPAPRAGTYELQLTAWSASGVAGPARTFRGPIETRK